MNRRARPEEVFWPGTTTVDMTLQVAQQPPMPSQLATVSLAV